MKLSRVLLSVAVVILLSFLSCSKNSVTPDVSPTVVPPAGGSDIFLFGADLSYANQILDHGGVFKDKGVTTSPYKIFKDHGANLARFRLWHNPTWTKTVYSPPGPQMYNDIADVEKSIGLARAQGMAIELDFHYSDTWADPGKQDVPAAWANIKTISVLKDSIYNYTLKILTRLNSKGLMPEYVQVGNETNCGMLSTTNGGQAGPPAGFPACNVCNGNWGNAGIVVNSAINAVRDAASAANTATKVLLHVADPKNVEWWFDNMKASGNVTDFDIVGFSYYPLWHTTVSLDGLSNSVATFRNKYGKGVMILETAYPWSTSGADSYGNALPPSGVPAFAGFPFTEQGQSDLLKKITQEVKDGGGIGVIVWEPDWITSSMKDLWNTGSGYENCAFFDFNGNALSGIDYMKFTYN